MFGYSRLFRSRWLALLWSIGIIWTATSFVGDQDDSAQATHNGVEQAADLNEIQALVAQLKR